MKTMEIFPWNSMEKEILCNIFPWNSMEKLHGKYFPWNSMEMFQMEILLIPFFLFLFSMDFHGKQVPILHGIAWKNIPWNSMQFSMIDDGKSRDGSPAELLQ